MASTTPGGIELTTEHLDKTEQALSEVTSKAGAKPEIDPKQSLHAPANHEQSHSWLRSLLPYKSLEDLENAWHMGNYVIDRKTGQKSFEEMSIYVRVSHSMPQMNAAMNIMLMNLARHASSILRV
jgi:phosphatidylserine decarboxylase